MTDVLLTHAYFLHEDEKEQEIMRPVAYPIKGTEYFDRLAGQVVLEQDWEQASDRDYIIRGRHSRTYYRHADRWLRSAVEAHRQRGKNPVRAAAKRLEAAAARAGMRASASEVEV